MRNSIPYLQLRNSYYHFRIPVPPELQGKFQCKEVTTSLKTQDKAKAIRLCMALTDKMTEVFA